MGIKGLTKLLAEHAPRAAAQRRVEDYRGRVIAIDASLSIYQFLVVVGRKGTEVLTNEAGEVTSHLQGMLNRTVRLLEAGIKPIFVFDGEPPDLKKKELAKRSLKRDDASKDLHRAIEVGDEDSIEKFSKRTVKITKKHNDDCKRLLRLMGVPVVEAPGEAEAQCAALCKNHKVYAVASEDMDSLTFGARRFLRHVTDLSFKKSPVTEFEVPKVLEELELTMDQFIDLCILSGCDYCENIKGIGGQRALKLIRQHGCIEEVVQNLNKSMFSRGKKKTVEVARRRRPPIPPTVSQRGQSSLGGMTPPHHVSPMGDDEVDPRLLSPDMGDCGMEDQHMDGLEGYEDVGARESPPHATPSSMPTIAAGDLGGSSRSGKAACWAHMTRMIAMQDGVRLVSGTCNYCHKEFTAGLANGTGHLNRHVKKCLQKLGQTQGGGVQTQLSYASDGSVHCSRRLALPGSSDLV